MKKKKRMSWSYVWVEENKSPVSLFSTLSLSIYITVFSEHLLDWPGQEEAPKGTKEKRLKVSGGSWRLCHLNPGLCKSTDSFLCEHQH